MTASSVAVLLETAPPLPFWAEAVHELVDQGLRTTLIVIGCPGPLLDNAVAAGCRTEALGSRSAKTYPRSVLRLHALLRNTRPDLVHAVGPVPTTLAGLACIGQDIPVLYHRHHIAREESRLFPVAAGRLADWVMPVSEAASAAARAEGADPARLCVAQNGVPAPPSVGASTGSRVRDSLAIPKRAAVIAVVARLRPIKGHDVLFAALPAVAAAAPGPVHVLVVGDGPGRDEVARAATEAEAAGVTVHLVGHKDDVGPWYAAADVVVVPSRQESFGLIAVEAMAAGRPVIASDVGGLREIGMDGSILLVATEDPEALATAIGRVLMDPALAADLVDRGRRRYASTFTTEAMVRRWRRCYDSVVASAR